MRPPLITGENPAPPRGSTPTARTSMRPPLITGENAGIRGEVAARALTSMRPPLITGENQAKELVDRFESGLQ